MKTITTNLTTVNKTVNNKIEDFGEKIGGARKDYYKQLRELADILAGIDCETLKKTSLSKLVKLPDLARLHEVGALSEDAARALLTIWRTIPTRPTRPYRLARWAEETTEKVAQCAALLGGAAVDEKTRALLDFQILTVVNWPAAPFSFGRFSVVGPDWFASDYRVIAGNRYYSRCQNLEDVPAAIAEAIAKDNEKRAEGPALAVYYTRAGQYFIAVKDKAEIVLGTYESSQDARTACQNDRAALIERYKQLRTIPALRREWNRPRVGQDWRKGQDVTPDTFAKVLPFRGVEFGNWVNQTERAALLNSAFDGFHDLAQVWGLTAEDMTLSGSLAFAFASRGIAGAAAHYEPGHEVINLTKKNGAGCMAHEWFHAVDYFAGALDGRGDQCRAQTEHPADSERGEAARELMVAIKKTDFFNRSKELAKFSAKGDYWVENCELAARGFEGVCGVILNAAGVCSDFLVNLLSMDSFTAKDALHRSDIYPYPSEAEAAELLPYYLRFLRTVFGHGEVSTEALQMAEAAHDKAEEERKAAAQIRAQREAEKKAKEEAHAEEIRKELEREEAKREAKATEIAEFLGAIPGVTGARRIPCRNGGVAVAALWDAQIITVFASAQEAKTKPAAEIAAAVSVMSYKCKPARTKNPSINAREHSVTFCKRNAAEFLDWVAAGAGRSRFAHEFAEFANKYGRHAENFRAEAEKMAADIARLEAEETQERTKEAQKPAEAGERLAEREGLALVATPEGVAIIETKPRATYKARKEIRANGGDWNKEAKQWQATEEKNIAKLCAWFGLSEAPTMCAEATTKEEEGAQCEESKQQPQERTEATTEGEEYAQGEEIKQQPQERPEATTEGEEYAQSEESKQQTQERTQAATEGEECAQREESDPQPQERTEATTEDEENAQSEESDPQPKQAEAPTRATRAKAVKVAELRQSVSQMAAQLSDMMGQLCQISEQLAQLMEDEEEEQTEVTTEGTEGARDEGSNKQQQERPKTAAEGEEPQAVEVEREKIPSLYAPREMTEFAKIQFTPEELESVKMLFESARMEHDALEDENEHTQSVIVLCRALLTYSCEDVRQAINDYVKELEDLEELNASRGYLTISDTERRHKIEREVAKVCCDVYGEELAAILCGEYVVEEVKTA